ncbi:VRR-NUC domain-containing protein [Vibrio cholerae]|uniref:VRR-NUC domain-containing protein n=1 Tax=Vibrio cholerae TaxID=666 RepID=UPI003530D06F
MVTAVAFGFGVMRCQPLRRALGLIEANLFMAQERIAKSLGVELIHLGLQMGTSKKEWKSTLSHKFVSVENAVLDHYISNGWQGYAGEGGLLLNLIKAMSFPILSPRHKSTFVEALYAKNVAFEEDKFDSSWLISNVQKATPTQVSANFAVMSSGNPVELDLGSFKSTQQSTVLDFFPNLSDSLLLGLHLHLGNTKLAEIAKIFAQDPYAYRKGWADVTIWKDGHVKFLEVKAPGDRIQSNQKVIIEKFVKPLSLDFAIVDVFNIKT